MQNAPEPACLVIADISGYTGYLAGVELDHAQDILGDLIGTVVGALRPTFKLAKLEGDAAFLFLPGFLPGAGLDGSALQDLVEGCYFAFRRRLRDIAQATRCECNACIRIPSLDLKLVAHHGTVARQKIAGSAELVGSDVILVHRLLKNGVAEHLGIPAYALYTDACIAAMRVTEPAAAGLTAHTETIEHIGEVPCWVRDLEGAWNAEQERKRLRIAEADTFWKRELFYDAPPAIVWEFLTSPLRRPQYSSDVTGIIEYSTGGRRGAGTTNHCMHGQDAIIEEIVDWRPPEYWTTNNVFPVPRAPKVLMSDELEALPGGRTRVVTRVARGRTAKARAFLDEVLPMLTHAVEEATRDLGVAVAEAARAHQRHADLTPASDSPGASVATQRFLTEPVTTSIAYLSGDGGHEPVDSGTVGSSSE